jgi:hypothetical protein
VLLAVLALGLLGHIILDKRADLRKQLTQARRDVKTMVKLRDEIQSMSATGTIPDQNQLLTIVTQALQDRNLNASSIRDGIEKVGRNEEKIVVEINFSGIPLEPLFGLLYDLEYKQTNGITVGDLMIRKPMPGREIYDVKLKVYVLQPVKGK